MSEESDVTMKPRANLRSHDHAHEEGADRASKADAIPVSGSDALLEKRLADLLGEDRMIDAVAVAVRARGGTIVLTGSVLSRGEFERAEACARALPEVRVVDNRLVVTAELPDDRVM